MKNERVSSGISLKEVSRKCLGRDQAELAGVPWFRRISYCISDVVRSVMTGFESQVDYPLGKIVDR